VISLVVFSTPFFTSTKLASQTVSNEGMKIFSCQGSMGASAQRGTLRNATIPSC
jgi:hypothetical protein